MTKNTTIQSSIYKSAAGQAEIMALYENVLQNWPVQYESQLIATRHGATYVICSGAKTAPPLILLHGAASNSLAWLGDILEYSKHFRVFAVDLIGEPGKSAPTRLPWEGSGYAEWLEDVMDGLGLEKAALLGISQGGWTALKFAVARPERVTKMVLLTPAGIVPTRVAFILKAVIFTMLGRWGVERLNRYLFGRQAVDPLALKFMNLIMTHFKARVDKEYLFADAELMRLQMPVLLIGGSEDVVRPVVAIASRLRQSLPQLQTMIIPEMGHVVVNISDRIVPFLLNRSNSVV